ncbi:hypothetical protein GBA52_008899 [Prunus armeniaca]|nr:hypothetical protein GBA52_008899 [Prunus armeniaca]
MVQPSKVKSTGKDATKDAKEKLSVSAMLASMDQKPEKPKKGSSSSAKAKGAPNRPSYTDGIDLPPSDEDVLEVDQQEQKTELKKRAQKDLLAAHAVEQAEKVALKDERDFLNTVCNEIIHLHDLKFHTYSGNFNDFETGSGTPHLQGGEQKLREASKNKAKGKVDEDETPAEAPKKWRDYSVEFHFPEPTELTPPFLQLVEVLMFVLIWGLVLPLLDLTERGKSTLPNLLAGGLVPSEGEVQRSQKLRIGRYSQHFVDVFIRPRRA